MENKIDHLFKGQLSNREEIPSPQAWNRINNELTNKKRRLWMKRLAVKLLIILLNL